MHDSLATITDFDTEREKDSYENVPWVANFRECAFIQSVMFVNQGGRKS